MPTSTYQITAQTKPAIAQPNTASRTTNSRSQKSTVIDVHGCTAGRSAAARICAPRCRASQRYAGETMSDGEIPYTRLTHDELEALRGGGLPTPSSGRGAWLVAAGSGLVAAVCS